MKDLFIRLNPSKKQATFFGPGTFEAKDRIKALGQARWLGDEKAWQVSALKQTEEELISLFPEIADIEIVEEEPSAKSETLKSKKENKEKVEKAASPSNLPAGYSVTEFLGKAQYAISQAFSVSIYVYGVLGKVTESNGRLFMDLVDQERPTDSVNCVIWSDVERLTKDLTAAGFKLEAELQVMFQVSVRLDRRARVSLAVERIVAEYTIGKLAALREKTNLRLKEEGVFAKNKERVLPFLSRRLGILTSSAGTVIHDFRASLDVAHFGFELFWLPVSVQGAQAKKEIVAGIKKLSAMDLDALLIFRGGGAPAELAVFSEYEVAKAICLCPLPVISAIGHQEDQSSTQDVSFLAFGVPKDIGRYFADIVINYRRSLADSAKLIQNSGKTFLERFTERLGSLTKPLRLLAEKLEQYRAQEFKHLLDKTGQQLARLVSDKEQQIERLNQRVEDSSPSLQLKRGFSIVRKKDSGELALRAAALVQDEEISIEFFDEQLRAKIT